MAKIDRLGRLDEQRIELEAEYRVALIAALSRTAAGHWGLFDHHDDRRTRAAMAPTFDLLCETGGAIDRARERLSLEPFDLHREFLASRGRPSPSAVGEPKQAQQWLDRLAREGGEHPSVGG